MSKISATKEALPNRELATSATVDSLLERVENIAPIIREHAAEAEERRRLSRPVVEAMLDAGLYRMSRPKAYGGLEAEPLTIFEVVEAVAGHDSAAAWNLQLSLAANCCVAWLPDDGAEDVLQTHPSTIIATSFTPDIGPDREPRDPVRLSAVG